MTTEPSDLARLARPFPRELVQRDPGGNNYVAHENVTQWLLGIVGPFSFELVEIIRGDVPGVPPDPKGRSRRAKDGTPELRNVIVGGVWRLTLRIDGRTTGATTGSGSSRPPPTRSNGAPCAPGSACTCGPESATSWTGGCAKSANGRHDPGPGT
jgi:hypothetical protein